MFITIEDAPETDSGPKYLGRCSGTGTDPCQKRVFDDDLDAVVLPKGVVCSSCMDKMFPVAQTKASASYGFQQRSEGRQKGQASHYAAKQSRPKVKGTPA